MNPSEEGYMLEEIISDAVNKFTELVHNLRESQIKQHFKDNSLNGVDHWIKFGQNNVLIQDKWKENTDQQEVSQFLECANRLNRRIPRNENIYLLWISKYQPTKNSMALLNERGVEVVCCNLSVEALARLAILRIAECLDVDPVPALLSIPKDNAPIPVERASIIMDEEAMEILKIRKELNEKKKQEQEEQKNKEIYIKELLKTDPAFSWKARVSPNQETKYYPHNNGVGELYKWDPNGVGTTIQQMLDSHNELRQYREDIRRTVETHVNNLMKNYWQKTDTEILNLPAGGRGAWGWPHNFSQYIIDSILVNEGSVNNETHPNYWKALIIQDIAKPIIKEEYENMELLMTCIKKIYLEHTKIPESDLIEILKHDTYLNAEECVKYGLVDEIV